MLKSNVREIVKLPLYEAALGCVTAGDGRAWPGFEPTHRAKARGADGERAGRRTRLPMLSGRAGARGPEWHTKRKPRPAAAERGFSAHDGRKSE